MALSEEVFKTLPEAAQGDYVLDEVTKEYVTADSLKFAGAKKNLDSAYSERDKFKGELTSYQQTEADRIAAAEKAAYDKAVADNDTTKLREIDTQKLKDALERAAGSEEKFNKLQQGLANEKKNTIIASLAEHGTKSGKAALARLLAGYVQVDPATGAETYLNDDGSASSLDRNGFITEQLKGNPVFESLVKADLENGSEGLANGSLGSAADSHGKKELTRDQFEKLTPNARMKFIKANGKIT